RMAVSLSRPTPRTLLATPLNGIPLLKTRRTNTFSYVFGMRAVGTLRELILQIPLRGSHQYGRDARSHQMKTIFTFLCILLTAPFITAQATSSKTAAPISNWVGMTASGAQLRVIIHSGSACPEARADGKRIPLVLRAEPEHASPDFPATCQAMLPAV